jgi:hypothetical protein
VPRILRVPRAREAQRALIMGHPSLLAQLQVHPMCRTVHVTMWYMVGHSFNTPIGIFKEFSGKIQHFANSTFYYHPFEQLHFAPIIYVRGRGYHPRVSRKSLSSLNRNGGNHHYYPKILICLRAETAGTPGPPYFCLSDSPYVQHRNRNKYVDRGNVLYS